jgi:hypothetical protein
MTHNMAHKAFKLRGLALRVENGAADAEFAATNLPDLREAVACQLRELADAVERAADGAAP